MKANKFDELFDADESILDQLDLSKAQRTNQKQKRVNVDFPLWVVNQLDKESKRLGVPRQALIKLWVAEHFKKAA